MIAAILTKNDFLLLLGESERKKIEEKVKTILLFDMFKNIPKNKLKNIYRFFFS